jgi:hypothetical protein
MQLPPLVPVEPEGFNESEVRDFTAFMKQHGIDTYFLLLGDQTNFCSTFAGPTCDGSATDPNCRCTDARNDTARQATIKQSLALLDRFGLTGVDLDYEHLPTKTTNGLPHSQSSDVYNETQCRYKEPFGLLLKELSAALHKRGGKLSQCVGYYPTMDGGAFDSGQV